MTPMTNSTVLLDVADRVATATLNRPDSLNSMTSELMDDLREAIERADQPSSGARVLVITGAGRGFCSGADLTAVGPGSNPTDAGSADDVVAAAGMAAIEAMNRHFNPTLRAIKNCRLPTLARLNGVAAGGGIGLALACDITIAASSAYFVATFGPRLGIVPDLGTTWSLPQRVGRARALGMAMLGDRIDAQRAADWGLIWQAVDDDRLDDAVAAATDVLKRSSADAVTATRSAIETAAERSFSEQLDLERDYQSVLIPKNMSEGARAFLENREPDFD